MEEAEWILNKRKIGVNFRQNRVAIFPDSVYFNVQREHSCISTPNTFHNATTRLFVTAQALTDLFIVTRSFKTQI
jgi:exopolysaccharide biosynthesis predicted pyruvyltransferase EpsI